MLLLLLFLPLMRRYRYRRKGGDTEVPPSPPAMPPPPPQNTISPPSPLPSINARMGNSHDISQTKAQRGGRGGEGGGGCAIAPGRQADKFVRPPSTCAKKWSSKTSLPFCMRVFPFSVVITRCCYYVPNPSPSRQALFGPSLPSRPLLRLGRPSKSIAQLNSFPFPLPLFFPRARPRAFPQLK